jgi:hypothetical protein
MTYDADMMICKDEKRRHRIRDRKLNGIDYLEVSEDQHQLTLRFLAEAPEHITKENVRITGGRRVTDIEVLRVKLCDRPDPEEDDCLIVIVDKPGDFSIYTLCLVALDENGRSTARPFPGFDPRYACIRFSFKEGCPSELDCAASNPCPPKHYEEPEINYLAKDYSSFRQLILDRLALIMPEWRDRQVPDLGITLVEIIAYVGDYLSYYQDAVATEAYLNTARKRISVRRHARLVDYLVHEGCNARTFVAVKTGQDQTLLPRTTTFITRSDHHHFPRKRVLSWDDLRHVPRDCYEVFAPLVQDPDEEIFLYKVHNQIQFYTWGDKECCLPKGVTSAYLRDGPGMKVPREPDDDNAPPSSEQSLSSEKERCLCDRELHIKPGDILIFEEVVGPETGCPYDADPGHRHAVRITRTEECIDWLYLQPVLRIFWAPEDALPFPLCISAMGPPPDCEVLEDVSMAVGNVMLVDHGRRMEPESLGCVPIQATRQACEAEGFPDYLSLVPGAFAPTLKWAELTFSEPLIPDIPASQMLIQDPRLARASVDLTSAVGLADPLESSVLKMRFTESLGAAIKKQLAAQAGEECDWEVVYDLLSSTPLDNHFVVEMDNDRRAHLRFGNGEQGRQVDAGHCFEATYRIGNGPDGHVGAETITHIVFDYLEEGADLQARNPMPAMGGISPESMADVKFMAPHAFRRVLERAITAEDYAALVMRDFKAQVQRAAATLRWTGSHVEVAVAIDPLDTVAAPETLLAEIEDHLYPYRRINHDPRVVPAQYVPLKLVLNVCVSHDHLRGHVKAALLARFSNRRLVDGTLGFFHPDNLTFGQDVFPSEIVAVAQAVPGVANVVVAKLHRQFEPSDEALDKGVLSLKPVEIARLDNDANYPENGVLELNMRGGR